MCDNYCFPNFISKSPWVEVYFSYIKQSVYLYKYSTTQKNTAISPSTIKNLSVHSYPFSFVQFSLIQISLIFS